MNIAKLQYPNQKQFIITIPKSIVDAKEWKKGDRIEFLIDEKGNILIKKIGWKIE